MTAIALLGQVTNRIEIGSAVVPVHTRLPIRMAQHELHPVSVRRPFTLGISTSHKWIVEGSGISSTSVQFA